MSKLEAERARVNLAALNKLREHFGSNAKMAAAIGLFKQNTAIWSEVPVKYVRPLAEASGWPVEAILPSPFPYTKIERPAHDEKAIEKRKVGRPKGSGKARPPA